MTMTVMMVPVATGELLLASCNLMITLCPVFLATCYLPLLLRTSILLGQLIDTKSDHPPSRTASKLRSATDDEPPSPQVPHWPAKLSKPCKATARGAFASGPR